MKPPTASIPTIANRLRWHSRSRAGKLPCIGCHKLGMTVVRNGSCGGKVLTSNASQETGKAIMRSLMCRAWVVFVIGTCLGCGKPPAEAPSAVQETPKISKAPASIETPVLTPTPAESPNENPVVKNAPAASNSTLATPTEKAAFPEAAYLSEDVVGVIVSHPRRIMELPVVQILKQAGLTEGIEQQSGLKTKPEFRRLHRPSQWLRNPNYRSRSAEEIRCACQKQSEANWFGISQL